MASFDYCISLTRKSYLGRSALLSLRCTNRGIKLFFDVHILKRTSLLLKQTSVIFHLEDHKSVGKISMVQSGLWISVTRNFATKHFRVNLLFGKILLWQKCYVIWQVFVVVEQIVTYFKIIQPPNHTAGNPLFDSGRRSRHHGHEQEGRAGVVQGLQEGGRRREDQAGQIHKASQLNEHKQR